MKTRRLFLLPLFISAAGCAGHDAALIRSLPTNVRADYLVVGPGEWFKTALPLLELRKKEGFHPAYLPTEILKKDAGLTPQTLRRHVRTILGKAKRRYLLLLGDADRVPTMRMRFCMVKEFGALDLASDWYYALEDASDPVNPEVRPVPDVAVGRLPADSEAELAVMLKKIIDYENCGGYGPWRRKINFVACAYGKSTFLDEIIEQAAASIIAGLVPAGFKISMTYGKVGSPYCWWPPEFEEKAASLFNEGCFAWVYAGHSGVTALDKVRFNKKGCKILDCASAGKLDADGRSALMVFLSCHTGAFQNERADCVAEALMKSKGGPAAVYASSTVSAPYGNAVMGRDLLRSLGRGGGVRLGDLVVRGKSRMLSGEAVPGALGILSRIISGIPPALEVHGHALMYNILGDPAMKLFLPGRVKELAVKLQEAEGGGITAQVSGRASRIKEGAALVSLEAPPGEFITPPAPPGEDGKEEDFKKSHALANNGVLAEKEVRVSGGKFEAALTLKGAPGAHVVKVYAWDKSTAETGAKRFRVKRR